jgi:hypothetical protein
LSEPLATVLDMASKGTRAASKRCPDCCEHGVAHVWFCAWCAELEEFGTSDFGIWGSQPAMPCEHSTIAAAS